MSIRKIVSSVAVALAIAVTGVSIAQAEDALPQQEFMADLSVKTGPDHIVMSTGDAGVDEGVAPMSAQMAGQETSSLPQHVLDTIEVH